MRNILAFIALLLPFTAVAQSEFTDILSQIELNNPTLATLRSQASADKLTAKTGLAPTDPEVEFHYLWGSPSTPGNRVDVSIKQSFDFPSVYAYKNKVAKLQGAQADLQYRVGRMELLTAARQLCIDIVYYNAAIATVEGRVATAQAMADAYARRLASGDGTAIENNRAQMTLRTIKVELANLKTERTARLTELAGFNGNIPIEVTAMAFDAVALPASFDQWVDEAIEHNPQLQHALGQVAVGKKQLQVARAKWLPKISIGYMSEQVLTDEHFQGIIAAISLPLWENSRAVGASKAAAITEKYRAEEVRSGLKSRLEALYGRAAGLRQTADDYRLAIVELGNMPLLDKALAAGNISLFEYILEAQLYYDNTDKALQAERDFQLCYADLVAFEY